MKLLYSIIFGFVIGMTAPGKITDWYWWFTVLLSNMFFSL